MRQLQTTHLRRAVSLEQTFEGTHDASWYSCFVNNLTDPQGPHPMFGLQGGHPSSAVLPMYAVSDVVAAVARVRAAGGTATDPVQMPYGITSDCVDDQGLRFYLGQL